MNNEHEFYIVEKMAYDLILNIDFLIKYAVTMKMVNSFVFEKEQPERTIVAITLPEIELRLEEIL